MSGSNPVEACLSYECRRRVSNKTSTSKPRPLHDFLEDAGGIFPFRSGLGLGTKSKSIFLSRNGFLQGKAWRVLGACRHGRDGEPFVVLLKAKSDSQLAILQHKELQSIGYVPLVGARGERDASGSPGLRYCCSQDLESVALWTSSSIQSYQESGAGGGRVLCKKYEVCSRAYLREENLIACDYSRDGLSLVALSHSEERGYSFKRYSLPGLDSQEIGPPHKGGIKGSEVAHASLSFGRGGAPQVCLATGDSRFCILDASLGVVCSRTLPKAAGTSALRSISWHKGRGLILCATDDSVFALDQALQELPWRDDRLHGDGNSSSSARLSSSDLLRGDAPGALATIFWDEDARDEATLTSEDETVVLGFGGGSREDSTFGSPRSLVLGYLESKRWPEMRALLRAAYLRGSDLRDLTRVVEDAARGGVADEDVYSWGALSSLFDCLKVLGGGRRSRAAEEAKGAVHSIALGYLERGSPELAVLLASTAGGVDLNEFLYKYLAQNGEPRLAGVCWANLRKEAGEDWRAPRAADGDHPRLLLAPATLRALARAAGSQA